MTQTHNYVSREARLVTMSDGEIQHVSRCYRCGGHHIARTAHVAFTAFAAIATVAATGGALALVFALAL